LIAIKGARIGEGRAPAIRRLLAEIKGSADAAQPVLERYRSGDAIPGFSHSIYKGGDARARALLQILKQRLNGDADFARLLEAIRVAHEGLGVEPDLSLLAYYIDTRLKPPDNSVSIQVIARIVGWIAHAYEQISGGRVIRPRTAYTGVLPAEIA
jgi:citrate synthase